MAEVKNTFTVFFSWQSDLPKETNSNAIRGALDSACKSLSKGTPKRKFKRDEALRGVSGSPNIIDKIIEKITGADAFIADITTIVSSGTETPCPNPNVVFELGYAVGELGWDRIILIFNEAFGVFPDDLPFDFVQNRVSRYKLEIAATSADDELKVLVQAALDAIIKRNPKRPIELRGLSAAKIKHDRDVENLSWLMSAIHLPTLDALIEELPYKITDRSLWFYEHFKGVVQNSLFNIYDPVLAQQVKNLSEAWEVAFSHDEQYNSSNSGNAHFFSSPGDMPLPSDRKAVWDAIALARKTMYSSLKSILERLHAEYIEIDIHKSNAAAWSEYISFQKDVEKKFS